MKIPRDLGAGELIKLLRKKYGYEITHQTGSHIRLTTTQKGEHSITIPNHNYLKIGTLNSILTDLAVHMEREKQVLIKELFE
ncbi:MAG: hypothetical protein A2452_11460 [Candidatus Firestonebacteria bacterium RIFOXYC2_FULL_39_67]|nr:MAG: hypothetical protein A2536_09895 [Candidatus Firestonebacteria bacterium RIFOXYD2_FULL_39_29]OGF54562.1 MAG: hypothetical protein A2452_11460 [Candidatus Firestonebacteria bacterium RIFOXYC2_FULL_39_67]OGF56483.1 MAG: hypothetical protein A2497_08925 [Candidatus Firestonebacteria bacterium RifOxyC12_full_39_7]